MRLNDIVVGLDGSVASATALAWAAGLATSSGVTARAVSMWQAPSADLRSVLTAMPSQAAIAERLAHVVDQSLAEADVELAVERNYIEGSPGPMLANTTQADRLVVVGRSGRGGRRFPLRSPNALGSAARYCVHHLKGPVAVVPPATSWVDDPTVVVGIDGSKASIAGLRWAATNLPPTAEIRAVWAESPYKEGLLALDRHAIDRIAASATQKLGLAIAEAVRPLDVRADRISTAVVFENARYAVVDPDSDVDLIIVGERGHGALTAALLGSTADFAIRHSPHPVIVVPEETGAPQ
jgi:nucleotide-binding universal stress UspA family protein